MLVMLEMSPKLHVIQKRFVLRENEREVRSFWTLQSSGDNVITGMPNINYEKIEIFVFWDRKFWKIFAGFPTPASPWHCALALVHATTLY